MPDLPIASSCAAEAPASRRPWMSGLGERSSAIISFAGGLFLFGLRTLRAAFGGMPRRRILLEQMYRIGNESVPVVITTGVFTGMVLAVQTYSQFRRVEMQSLVGAVVGISMTKELGPVLTGLMLSGRVGAAMAAELGTMKVTEQIDAMRTLATDPMRFLVLPRFLACLLLTPVLTVLADAVGLTGAFLLSVYALHVPSHFYLSNALEWMDTWSVLSGLVKAAVFGGLISIICCYKGMNAGEGALGVGRATTQAVVAACIGVLISDFFLTVMMY